MTTKRWPATVIFDLWGVLINYPSPYPAHHSPNFSHVALDDGAKLAQECAQAGHQLFVLSNCSDRTKQEVSKHFPELFSLFHDFITSESTGLKKPDPAFFTHLLKKYSIEPASAIFLDDSPANIKSAQNVGITGIDYHGYAAAKKTMHLLGVL